MTKDWGLGIGKLGNGEWGLGIVDLGFGNGDWGMGIGEWGMGNGEWGIESDLISLKQIKSEYISLVIASCFAISDFLFGIPHCC